MKKKYQKLLDDDFYDIPLGITIFGKNKLGKAFCYNFDRNMKQFQKRPT